MSESKRVEDLAERIHAARGLLPPCPDNNDEDADAWCHDAARIVIADGWMSPEEHHGEIERYSTEAREAQADCTRLKREIARLKVLLQSARDSENDLEAERAAVQDKCNATLSILADVEDLAAEMVTPGYLADSDGWGYIAAREIRARIDPGPIPPATNPATT